MTTSDYQEAERLSQRRARIWPVLAILLLVQQGSFLTLPSEPARTVDHVKIAAWLVLSCVLLLGLVTGGGWFRRKSVRALLDDEVTRAHRRHALANAFIATMVGAIFIYFVTLFEPVDGREAVHVLMTIGIAAGLLQFAKFERRAMRDA